MKLMKNKKNILPILFLGLLLAFSCQNEENNEEAESNKIHTFENLNSYPVETIEAIPADRVKNVILMIGDGMGLMHAYSAWTANKGHLNLENCEYVGLAKTYCSDNLITDSAASGTAMSTGQKTKKGYVGVDTTDNSLKSICEYASEANLSTGIISSCRLIDATPATFAVENIDRDKSEEIAASYVHCDVDFILGGGMKYFTNLLPEFEKNGYQVAKSMEELETITEGKVFAPIAENDMGKPTQRKDQLWQSTKKALDILSTDDDGFFLMVEGSMIDDYGHFNELPTLMEEILDFDQTVGKVFDWAAKHPGTLVIVTSDHETGGLTLLDGDLKEGKIECNFSSKSHSGVMVPVYSFGARSGDFSGIYENTDLFYKMMAAFGLEL